MAAAKPSWNSGTYRAGMWQKHHCGLLGNKLRPGHATPDLLGARSTSCRHVMDSATLRRICTIRSPRLRPEEVLPFADRLEYTDWRMLPASPPQLGEQRCVEKLVPVGTYVGSLRTIEQIQLRVLGCGILLRKERVGIMINSSMDHADGGRGIARIAYTKVCILAPKKTNDNAAL